MEGPKLYLFTAAQIVGVCAALWYVFTLPPPWTAERIAGVALLLVGICGIATARYQLGKSFAIRAAARQLVTHGLYSKIRNPIYVFGTFALVGIVLMLQKPALWILVAVVIAGQTLRARREARVLEAAFGDEYREYRRKTWF